jgi:type II secretory pathway pseudopilin PulG
MKWQRRKHQTAFTMLELLVEIAIIATLFALILPAVQRVRESANRSRCGNNLKQIGLALQHYHNVRGRFPSGYLCDVQADPAYTAPGWGWAAQILNYLEQEPLYYRINVGVPIEDPSYANVRTVILNVFVCPSDRNTGVFDVPDANGSPLVQAATSSYAASFGTGDIASQPDQGNGVFYRNSKVQIGDIGDGSSNTLAVGERGALLARTPWAGAVNGGTARITPGAPTTSTAVGAAPVLPLAHVGSHALNAPDVGPDDFFTPHPVSALFAFADGSVRPVSRDVSLTVLQALATRSGGEIVNPDGP